MTPDAVAAAAAAHFAAMTTEPDNAELLMTMVRVSVLRAFGCTCHNPGVEACWHTEDLRCPIHPATVTS